MRRRSVLASQSVRRRRRRPIAIGRKSSGQLGFGLVKIFLFLCGLAGLSLMFVWGYQFVSESPYFRLDNIIVDGVGDELARELIKISGIERTESLLSLDVSSIRRNIESHPWIRSVFLKKDFPHTLRIRAENEEPRAIVLLDKMYLVGTRGRIFKELARGDSVDLPVITGLSAGDDTNGEFLKRAVSFLNLLRLEDAVVSVEELSELHLNGDGSLTIYISRLPFKVCLGSKDFGRKLDLLGHIIKHLRINRRLSQVQCIDLDYGDRAIVAFRNRVVRGPGDGSRS
jgi:cell division protein FtsQ